jgi:hypothetical protein
MTPITCCPFCGADIDNEERPWKILKKDWMEVY